MSLRRPIKDISVSGYVLAGVLIKLLKLSQVQPLQDQEGAVYLPGGPGTVGLTAIRFGATKLTLDVINVKRRMRSVFTCHGKQEIKRKGWW